MKDTMLTKNARGAYVLVVHNREDVELGVGALGVLTFKAGWYLYVGSAMSGLRARIRRHFNTRKLRHWHIDYLTNVAHIDGAAILESNDRLECNIAHRLQTVLGSTRGFGCSDCECCSHLFFAPSEAEAWENGEHAVASFDAHHRLMTSKELRAFFNQS